MNSSTNKTNNMFVLSRLQKNCHYQPVFVDFNPLRRINNVEQKIIPEFNFDRKYYTPAFLTAYERNPIVQSSQSSDQTKKEFFQQKIKQNLSKPSGTTPVFNADGVQYCSVCDVRFSQYWKHISQVSHLKKIKASRANGFIQELCDAMNQNEQLQESKIMKAHERKTKKIKKKTKTNENINRNENKDLIFKWPPEIFSFYVDSKKPVPSSTSFLKN